MWGKKIRVILEIFFVLGFVFLINQTFLYAQTSEEKAEQREAVIKEAIEALEKPETAKDIVEKLKERALLKVKEKRQMIP